MPDRVYSFRDEVPAIDIDEPSLPQPWICMWRTLTVFPAA